MKPDAPAEYRGEFKPIASSLPGLQVCEHLPRLARVMHEFSLVRTVSTMKGPPQHASAHNLIRFGRLANRRDPVNRPNWGAVVSAGRAHPNTGLPNFVVVGSHPGRGADVLTSGYLGYPHAPMMVPNANTGLPNLAAAFDPASFDDRLKLLADLDRDFLERSRAVAAQAHRTNQEAALRMMRSPAGKAFDLSQEPAALRDAYGRHPFGQGALMARRLVDIGVPFVEVTYPNGITGDGDWDTHAKNFPTLKDVLLPQFDAALPALITDLKDRGLLESTLVVAIGEMGRTPLVSKNGGREHFCVAFPALFAGGGVRAGQVIGKTSANGMEVEDRPVTAPEILASVCRAVGVDGGIEFDTSTGKRIEGESPSIPPSFRATLVDPAAQVIDGLFK